MDGAVLMPDILAFTESAEDTEAVQGIAAALARTLHLKAEQRELPSGIDDVSAAVLLSIDDPTVQLAVLPYCAGDLALKVTGVIRKCPKPVVLMPIGRGATAPGLISRVLVPLDGTPESAETMAETVALFAASGTDIVVLHVFDETTVPKFWDQPAHARKSWDEEFLARYCNEPDARLELRTGRPGESILDVAATEHADLIALGWAQDLSAGRARTVRTTLSRASTPILLLPVASPEAGSPTGSPVTAEKGIDA
jgi:nucleotide-binding universal stress UspA family protein